jgi:competence protein ComGC
MSPSSLKDVPILAFVLVDLIVILILSINIYFFFVVPNRSRQLTEAERFNPITVRV